jgi:hypothetical protein
MTKYSIITPTKPKSDLDLAIKEAMEQLQPLAILEQEAQRLQEAQLKLESRKKEIGEALRAAIARAGLNEAERLLGNTQAAASDQDGAKLTELRQQQENLEIAAETLQAKQAQLDEKIIEHQAMASNVQGKIVGLILAQLRLELMPLCTSLVSMRNKIAAIRTTLGVNNFVQKLEELQILDPVTGENILPITHYPQARLSEPRQDPWRNDKDAAALHQKLEPIDNLLRTYRRRLSRAETAQTHHNATSGQSQHEFIGLPG